MAFSRPRARLFTYFGCGRKTAAVRLFRVRFFPSFAFHREFEHPAVGFLFFMCFPLNSWLNLVLNPFLSLSFSTSFPSFRKNNYFRCSCPENTWNRIFLSGLFCFGFWMDILDFPLWRDCFSLFVFCSLQKLSDIEHATQTTWNAMNCWNFVTFHKTG